jgi:ribonucleoside-diphosphate reductase alpha chain
MKDKGFIHEPAIGKEDSTTIFSFAMKSPDGAVMRDKKTAIEQLEHWLMFQESWCEHKPSITVYVREHEWLQVGAWVYDHFEIMSGVSFLPYDNGNYKQAPYTDCNRKKFLDVKKKTPLVDWGEFMETEDNTTSSQELACTAGSCEI